MRGGGSLGIIEPDRPILEKTEETPEQTNPNTKTPIPRNEPNSPSNGGGSPQQEHPLIPPPPESVLVPRENPATSRQMSEQNGGECPDDGNGDGGYEPGCEPDVTVDRESVNNKILYTVATEEVHPYIRSVVQSWASETEGGVLIPVERSWAFSPSQGSFKGRVVFVPLKYHVFWGSTITGQLDETTFLSGGWSYATIEERRSWGIPSSSASYQGMMIGRGGNSSLKGNLVASYTGTDFGDNLDIHFNGITTLSGTPYKVSNLSFTSVQANRGSFRESDTDSVSFLGGYLDNDEIVGSFYKGGIIGSFGGYQNN